MRSALLVVLALAFIPSAAAHEEGLHHVNPVTASLDAQGSQVYDVLFEEGDLRSDWLFILNAIVTAGQGPVSFELRDRDGPVANWTAPSDGLTHPLTGRIRQTAPHHLQLVNLGADRANVTFFYDASCNCAGKPIPPQVPQALVVFQVDPAPGARFATRIFEPTLLTTWAMHAIRVDPESRWPQDFEVLSTSTSASPVEGRPAHSFEWKADDAQRHYFVVQAIATDLHTFHALPPNEAVLGVYVEPSTTRIAEESPVASAPLVFLATLATACFFYKRK